MGRIPLIGCLRGLRLSGYCAPLSRRYHIAVMFRGISRGGGPETDPHDANWREAIHQISDLCVEITG